MRIAVDGIYFDPGGPFWESELIALAAGVGADGVNWPLKADHGGQFDNAADAAPWLEDQGVAVVALGLTKQLSATPGAEQEFREFVRYALEVAAALGVTLLDCWPYKPPEVTKADARAVLTSNIEAVLPEVEAAGCLLSFEFEPDTTIERYGEAVQFIRQFGPAARLTADTYHIVRIGDELVPAAETIADRFGIIHLSGSHRGEPGSEGDRCDHAAFVQAAVRAGYTGDLVLQYAPPENRAASLARAVAVARAAAGQ